MKCTPLGMFFGTVHNCSMSVNMGVIRWYSLLELAIDAVVGSPSMTNALCDRVLVSRLQTL